MTNFYLRVFGDGNDAERLERALDGKSLLELVESLVRHLHRWQQDSTGEAAAAYGRACDLVLSELDLRGLDAKWDLTERVVTGDGRTEEKVDLQPGSREEQQTLGSPTGQ